MRGAVVKTGERIVIVLDPLADDVPTPVRLRQLLKPGLRSCRLRAVSVVELPPDAPDLAAEVERLRKAVETSPPYPPDATGERFALLTLLDHPPTVTAPSG